MNLLEVLIYLIISLILQFNFFYHIFQKIYRKGCQYVSNQLVAQIISII